MLCELVFEQIGAIYKMSLKDFQIVRGCVIKQYPVSITDKIEQSIASSVSNKTVKVFRLFLSCDRPCTFIIKSGTQVVRKLFFDSDTGAFSEGSASPSWPIFTGEDSSDLMIYQSDVAAVDAFGYFQYKQE